MFYYYIICYHYCFRFRKPITMRTEDFLNPDEESEIEKLVDEETIIQAVQEG